MWGPASGLDLAHDAAGHVIARQQLGRTPSGFVALRIAPAFFGIGCRLRLVVVRNVTEHEPLAFVVFEDAPLAACAFGDEDAFHARRPPCLWDGTARTPCR